MFAKGNTSLMLSQENIELEILNGFLFINVAIYIKNLLGICWFSCFSYLSKITLLSLTLQRSQLILFYLTNDIILSNAIKVYYDTCKPLMHLIRGLSLHNYVPLFFPHIFVLPDVGWQTFLCHLEKGYAFQRH